MSVTAVIPNWNRRDLLVSLLEDWSAQTIAARGAIVVDNGSTDGSVEAARAQGATVIALPVNRGFAYAVNRGIEQAHTEWVAVLNNDVRLPPRWLEDLLGAARHQNAWFAAGKLVRASDPSRIDGTYDLLSRGACAWRAGSGRLDGPEWSAERPIHFAPFTAAVFRRELFEKVGLLDESFESYLEDVEFGLRCALAGFTGVYTGAAAATHEGSATLGRWNPDTVRRLARNQLLLVARHYPTHWVRPYGWPVFVGQFLWGLVAARHGAGLAFLRGKWEARHAFRTPRRDNPRLAAILSASEQEIRTLQQTSGYDWFWRIYFLLT